MRRRLMSKRILVIPDPQCAPGLPTEHLSWAGKAIMEYKPDVIVHIGDHWTMDSISSYASRKDLEGARYKEDIDAGTEGMDRLLEPMRRFNQRRAKNKKAQYKPRMVFCLGNHEQRIQRTIQDNPQFDGWLNYPDDLPLDDWEVSGFREPVEIEGVLFSHYFYSPDSGRPYGGTALSKLKYIGNSFVMGHQQGLDYALRQTPNGKLQHGLVAGSFYLHDEDYRGPQAN